MRALAVAVALAVLGAACSGGSEASTTVPDLEFSSGEIPFTVPEGFPIPEGAVVGTTMIDGVNDRTEMIITFPANVPEVAAFYETQLPIQGFAVTASSGSESEWTITHGGDDVIGTIVLTFGGQGVTSGTFIFDTA